jgi:hypothetical protein
MWALGNYSRFIRPEAKRLGVSAYNTKGELVTEGDTDPYALMISAYENADGTLVVVVINYHEKERTFDLEWKGKTPKAWIPYCTSDKQESDLKPLEQMKPGKKVMIPGRSIVTYVGIK